MGELLSSTFFWALVFAVVASIICPIVSIVRWLRCREELRRARGIPKTKSSAVKNVLRGIGMFLLSLQNRSAGLKSWESIFNDEAKEFKRQAEIEVLKKRPCDAKLPDAPEWHCECGRVNPAHQPHVCAAGICVMYR